MKWHQIFKLFYCCSQKEHDVFIFILLFISMLLFVFKCKWIAFRVDSIDLMVIISHNMVMLCESNKPLPFRVLENYMTRKNCNSHRIELIGKLRTFSLVIHSNTTRSNPLPLSICCNEFKSKNIDISYDFRMLLIFHCMSKVFYRIIWLRSHQSNSKHFFNVSFMYIFQFLLSESTNCRLIY